MNEYEIVKFGLKAHSIWNGMRERCRSGKATIDTEWENFENFYRFFKENYVEGWHLDKDLLSNKNNKIYSENTCVFIPQSLNSWITCFTRIKHPIFKRCGKFHFVLGKKTYTFENEIEATKTYYTIKTKELKDLYAKYKDKLSSKAKIGITNIIENLNNQNLNLKVTKYD